MFLFSGSYHSIFLGIARSVIWWIFFYLLMLLMFFLRYPDDFYYWMVKASWLFPSRFLCLLLPLPFGLIYLINTFLESAVFSSFFIRVPFLPCTPLRPALDRISWSLVLYTVENSPFRIECIACHQHTLEQK